MGQDTTEKFMRPLPQRSNELLRDNLNAPDDQNPNKPSYPSTKDGIVPDNRPPQQTSNDQKPYNRGQIVRRDDDNTKDISIGLQDHDEAIDFYFKNVIKPTVVKNGQRVKVPLVYGSPEKWKSVQRDGYNRDKEGKIQTPFIMFKRNSIEKRRDLGNKMDANNPHLYQTFEVKYSQKNQYDNFSVLQNRIPQREMHAVVVPDYVTLNYSFIVWTDFVAHNNKIIEAINYASDSYWGDFERFKFNARIDSFANKIEISQGTNRMVKTDFTVKLQGYIIPDAMSASIKKHPTKTYTRSQISISENVQEDNLENERARHKINKVGDGGAGIGYDKIGHQQIG